MMEKKKESWTMRRTALHFNVSLGLVSESLLLVSHYGLIRTIKKRTEALRVVRKNKNARNNCKTG